MSKTVVVRYRTRPDAAEENARLVEGVFTSLAEVEPGDFRYTTYRLADGVTFVHVARYAGDGQPAGEFAGVRRVPARVGAALRRAAGAERGDRGRLVRVTC
jgi:hypothetical protein